ncbi:MAG: HAD family hydrolase [Candidatus Obscuribacterales bacterium]
MSKINVALVIAFAVQSLCWQLPAFSEETSDPLPSWNEGAAKKAILQFVHDTTTKGGADFVPPEERIATFDQDGTLWVEQPMYAEYCYALAEVKALAPQHPEWKTEEPFASVLAGDQAMLKTMNAAGVEKIVGTTHGDMTVQQFQKDVTDWLGTAKHPRFNKPYTQLTYEPMQEVMRYLRANGFQTYIVTGGGQDFVRAFAEPTYGVQPQQVIGTMGKSKFEYKSKGNTAITKEPQVLLVVNNGGKPEAIHLVVGRRPIAAFGNSGGDKEMLEYTQSGSGKRLMMLVHHDDAEREYDYGPKSRVGTFSDELMKEANDSGWSVISIKNDWKKVFR